MWEWILTAISKIFGGNSVVDGFEKLTGRQVDWIERVEKRLDDCEEDRGELRRLIRECDDERTGLKWKLVGLEHRVKGLEERS